MPKITFHLNGKVTETSYEPGMHFLEVLREECGIVSAKDGCAPEGTCGCCLVLINGSPALSCLRQPEQMQGHDVVTLRIAPRRNGADYVLPTVAALARLLSFLGDEFVGARPASGLQGML